MRRYQVVKSLGFLGCFVFALLLAGCGGGGNGGGGNNATPPASSTTYTIGGTLSGLGAGKSVTLQDNGADDLTLAANGGFTFATAIASGALYSVTVLTQPSGQTCTVTNGSGTVGGANVANVSVTCIPNTYTISGNLSGLGAGKSVVLQNNGSNDLTFSTNGSFTFSATIASGAAYNVTVRTQPVGQSCAVANGSGTVGVANVTNVSVGCVVNPPAVPNPTLGYGIKQLRFSWPVVAGATFYRLFENPDGVSGYTQVGADLTVTSITHDIALHRRVNARYVIAACNSSGCTNSAALSLAANLVPAIGYFKASNTGVFDQFGSSIALSSDGYTLAVGAPGEDSAATGINGNQGDNIGTDMSGAVYVFTRVGSAWAQQAYVKASNTHGLASFGSSLALSADGNTLAVGAPGEGSAATGVGGNQVHNCSTTTPTNCATHSGAVYVFTRTGINWSQQAYVKASNTGPSDYFGSAVALSSGGSTLAVGARGEDSAATGVGGNQIDGCLATTPTNCSTDSGAVYVFTRTNSAWTQHAYVKASNTGQSDGFGSAIAISSVGDNTLAVGAPMEDSSAFGIGGNQADDSAPNAGAVYVFIRSGSAWSQQAYVKASNTGQYDDFGSTLALSADGNTLAVGAPVEDSAATGINGSQTADTASASGAAYVFTRSGTAWSQQAYVKASNTAADSRFGQSVALSGIGNTLAVGARGEDSAANGVGGNQTDNTAPGSGAVYVFARAGSTWTQQTYVKAPNTERIDFFGNKLFLSDNGSTLAVGANYEDSAATGVGGNQVDDCGVTTPANCATNSGAVYLY